MPEPYVPTVRLKPDNSLELDVTLDSFSKGKSAEISGYVTQNGNVFPFYSVQPEPAPDQAGKYSLTVTLPPIQGLAAEQDITVITRVTEVLIWPTVLAYKSPPGSALRAIWQARSYATDPAAGQGSSQPLASVAPTAPVPGTPPGSDCPPPTSGSPLTITAGGVRITIEGTGQ